MLDRQDFIKERGGDPEKIRESQRRRFAPVELVDEVIELWEDHRRTAYSATQVGSEINATQKQIGAKKKAKEDATDLLKQKDELTKRKKELEDAAAEKEVLLNAKIKSVGNYVHDSVPVSDNEDNNVVVGEWKPEAGLKEKTESTLSHHQIAHRLGAYDGERALKLVGHRGYCLTGYGVFLNQALINYGLEFLFTKGYSPNQPPFLMNRSQMAKTAQLSDFDEELYKVTGDGEDKYLIATSEQPLSGLHSEEWLQPGDLPIRYAGYSTNFRKEAGKHGKEAWGLFRIHQFEKVEQFVLCKPEESWEQFDQMIGNSQEFYKSLGLPYRVVAIVSGALNDAASKKHDLEAWFPFQQEYKELVSCSNCTDFQTRELEIRHGVKKAKEAPGSGRKEYVHALNATLTATERTLCCIFENYQTEEGLIVPEVLRKYIPGQPEFLPFVKDLPKEMTVVAGQGKKK